MFQNEPPLDDFDAELAELEELSNQVLDLVKRRRFDEADRACLELKLRFPDQIDWIDRSAHVSEARGDFGRAIEHYELCLRHIARHPDDFDDDSRAWYRDQIDRLQRRKAGAASIS
jgi:hypothetical protein